MEDKPKYAVIRARRRDDLEADLTGQDPSLICDPLFSAAQHDPDWLWAPEQCLKMLKHSSPLVRSSALIALKEIATFQGHLELETVLPEIDRLLTDPELGPFAADAMDDIRASGLSIPADMMLHDPSWRCSRHASHLFGFAFACEHLIAETGHGFHTDFEDALQAEEERPPAWCDECEVQHLRTGGITRCASLPLATMRQNPRCWAINRLGFLSLISAQGTANLCIADHTLILASPIQRKNPANHPTPPQTTL